MALFNIPTRNTNDVTIIQKAKKKRTVATSMKSGTSLLDKISNIVALVNKYLGNKQEDYLCIRTVDELHNYIDKIIENKIYSIDTETTGLNPLQDKIVGFSLYTPGQKACYIPMNHVSFVTGTLIDNQITKDQACEELKRLVEAKCYTILHNAKFDIRFIKNQIGVKLFCDWDTLLAAKLLNENEPTHALKPLHKKYVLNNEGDAFKFDELFDNVPFDQIPIQTGYLYAARDAEITFQLYEFQKPYLDKGDLCKERGLEKVADVLHNIEVPLIDVLVEMEDLGVDFNIEKSRELSEKYHKQLDERRTKFYKDLEQYEQLIEQYKIKNINHKLDNPINISSPTQIAILFYDVLQVGVIDKKSPRGTGVEILEKIDNPLAKDILDVRETEKLLSTYIDKLPLTLDPTDKRCHCTFNAYGAKTGRMSSNDPNLQNIPSHNDEIRQMFKATDGYVLVGSDYSGQEVRLVAHMANDEKMIQTYIDGKDLYCEIASIAFEVPYDECKEFREDGTKNPEGKQRRNTAKAIVLGINYGKGIPAIAEDLKITKEKAQLIYDKILKRFTGLANFIKESERMARENGFVTTAWGRKRRLPEMQLPQYEFEYISGYNKQSFDPLFDDENTFELSNEVDENLIISYTNSLNRAYGYQAKQKIIQEAKERGIQIKDNQLKISDATRQVVNSRVQGSAADLTKLAMISVHNNQELKDLGFRLLIPVHDELIGECPEENAKRCGELLSQLMKEAAKDVTVPMKCDVEYTKCWYDEPLKI